MAIGIVQDDGYATAAAATTVSQAFGISCTAGNLIVAVCNFRDSSGAIGTPDIFDNVNPATYALTVNITNTRTRTEIGYKNNILAGSITVFADSGAAVGDFGLLIYEISDAIDTDPPVDVSATNTGTSTTPSTSLVTPTTTDFIVGTFTSNGTTTITANDFPPGVEVESGVGSLACGTQFQISAAAVNIDWTNGTSHEWSAGIAAYKGKTAGPPAGLRTLALTGAGI